MDDQTSNYWRDRSDAPELAMAITDLLMAFRDRPTDPTAIVEIYCGDFCELELSLVRRVCRRFRTGCVDGHNAAFAPSVAEMWAEIDRLREEDREHERRMAPRLALPPPPRLTPEQAAKGAAILEEYANELRADTVDHEAEKRRETWKEMGPRLWERFGHDPSRPWQPSAELEELIRSKPLTKAEQEAA
jgi:hypothetical protein